MALDFSDKTIFVISYENWGKMMMSKHHYALELANMGNDVFFVNHSDRRNTLRRGEIKIENTTYARLKVINHRPFIPYFVKFRWPAIYNFFIRFHIRKIIQAAGNKVDIAWSFDGGNTLPLKYFGKKSFKIYMPVDGPFWVKEELLAAEQADLIVSVTTGILDRLRGRNIPMLLLGHGISSAFLENVSTSGSNGQIKVGYSGSLIRGDIDRETFTSIIRSHPEINFQIWGEYDPSKSNIHFQQDVSEKSLAFIETLKQLKNVILHGPVVAEELAKGIQEMDAFLICYDIKDCQNSHKILEFLATGKVIISSYVKFYSEHPDLVEMTANGNNFKLPELFNEVISKIKEYNSEEKQEQRKDFAREKTYKNNISRIAAEINRLGIYN